MQSGAAVTRRSPVQIRPAPPFLWGINTECQDGYRVLRVLSSNRIQSVKMTTQNLSLLLNFGSRCPNRLERCVQSLAMFVLSLNRIQDVDLGTEFLEFAYRLDQSNTCAVCWLMFILSFYLISELPS